MNAAEWALCIAISLGALNISVAINNLASAVRGRSSNKESQ